MYPHVKALQCLAVKLNEPFHRLIRDTVLAPVIDQLDRGENKETSDSLHLKRKVSANTWKIAIEVE